jgi:hypothetical protein
MNREELKEIITSVIKKMEASSPTSACGILYSDCLWFEGEQVTTLYGIGEEDTVTTLYGIGEEDTATTLYGIGEED